MGASKVLVENPTATLLVCQKSADILMEPVQETFYAASCKLWRTLHGLDLIPELIEALGNLVPEGERDILKRNLTSH